MVLRLESAEAQRLARELAELTGETLEVAVTVAVRERLERERRVDAPDIVMRLRRLSEEVGRYPVIDPSPPDVILGYDDHGLPH